MIKYFSVLYDGLEDIEKIEFEYYKEDINWNFGPKFRTGPILNDFGPIESESNFLTTDRVKSVPPNRLDSSPNQQISDQNFE